MKLIDAYELHNREQSGLPTLIIDARMEDEQMRCRFIHQFETQYLDGETFGGRLLMPSEVDVHIIANIKAWQTAFPTALVAVGCTRMVKQCDRIAQIVNKLNGNDIQAKGIDPHLIEYNNVRMRRMLVRVAF
jgi:hypothetical protein